MTTADRTARSHPTQQHPIIANSHAALANAVVVTVLAVMAAIPMVTNGDVFSPNARRAVYGIDVYLLTLA